MNVPIIKTVVTYLEIGSRPGVFIPLDSAYSIELISKPDVRFYLNLYRDVGRDYIWNYRPGQSIEEVQKIIHSDENRLYVLYEYETPIGFAEIDFTSQDEVEIIHFGLIPTYTHRGIGQPFLNQILQIIWNDNPDRIVLSTCGLDHPKAIKFYCDSGFSIFQMKIADFNDWRFGDFYTVKDAPQIPLGVSFFNCQTTHYNQLN